MHLSNLAPMLIMERLQRLPTFKLLIHHFVNISSDGSLLLLKQTLSLHLDSGIRTLFTLSFLFFFFYYGNLSGETNSPTASSLIQTRWSIILTAINTAAQLGFSRLRPTGASRHSLAAFDQFNYNLLGRNYFCNGFLLETRRKTIF